MGLHVESNASTAYGNSWVHDLDGSYFRGRDCQFLHGLQQPDVMRVWLEPQMQDSHCSLDRRMRS